MAGRNNIRLLPMSRITPREEMDSVQADRRQWGDHRAFAVLMEAEHHWDQMERFRRDRERNKRYTYGDQWGDRVCVPQDDGSKAEMTEEEYIIRQGSVPLKNNLIRRLVKSVLGVYRSQTKEPTCKARDRDEQRLGETMSTILQCNMQLNHSSEVLSRTMEEFLISGLMVHRKSYGWRNGKEDCWTDYVQPNNFFVDANTRDFRGWDVSILGEIHDVTFGQLCEQFASSPEEYARLGEIYRWACRRDFMGRYLEEFGYSRDDHLDFLVSGEPGLCRVIEVWRKEQKPRYRCHDYLTGDIFKIEVNDYGEMVAEVNEQRLRQGLENGMDREEIPLVQAQWMVDDYWYYYYLTPMGDILREGETPYEHGSHPYVFKAYPYIDGEIHSFVADVIDQQRYTNRLITTYDWIMRASAKGVMLLPEDCLPDGMSINDFAESWTEFNGVIVYKPSKSGNVPQQVHSNSTNIGITELLNLQLKFFEDISGVTGALQGRPGYSGESAAHFNQQTQNATLTLLDIMECFSDFVKEGAMKDVKNMQQFYDSRRVFNIAGKDGAPIVYDPQKIRDVEFDLTIVESTATPAYRMIANDMLMQLWQSGAITVQQLLEHGDFPFADKLLQSIEAQGQQMAAGQQPEGIPPQLMQQAQQGANMEAVDKLHRAMVQG